MHVFAVQGRTPFESTSLKVVEIRFCATLSQSVAGRAVGAASTTYAGRGPQPWGRSGGDGGGGGGGAKGRSLNPDVGAVEIGIQEEGRLMIVLALMLQLMRQVRPLCHPTPSHAPRLASRAAVVAWHLTSALQWRYVVSHCLIGR